MKKVALVTCYFQPNYGSMLQAYATQQLLDNWGIPNETICIEGFKDEIKVAKLKYFISRMLSADVIKDKWGFVKLALAKKIYKNSLAQNSEIRNKKFKEFKNKYFRISKQFSSLEELTKHAFEYSAFLVGSDQLWLPSNIAADYYTLNFVPDEMRKIAYATSFGVSVLPRKQQEAAEKFLPRFQYLSVREQSGQMLIKNIIGKDVPVICDPTLLLTEGDWRIIQKGERIINEPYIFCYFLGDNPYPREFVKKLKEITGFKIVALQQLDAYIKSDETFADEAPYNVAPDEFINLIRFSEYVCTDSFHGTIFSVLNQKSFYTFRRFKKKTTMSTNSRIDSLLNVLDLTERIMENQISIDDAIKIKINYEMVSQKLAVFRENSISYLKKAISNLE